MCSFRSSSDTWAQHNQSRLIIYISDHINAKRILSQNNDLPSATFEIGLGREKKTLVNFYYREWTSGITGDKTKEGQSKRLERQIRHWQSLSDSNRDLIYLGDANLCAMSWHNDNFEHKDLANQIIDFNLTEGHEQLCKQFTRIQKCGDRINKSCLDHITVNSPNK